MTQLLNRLLILAFCIFLCGCKNKEIDGIIRIYPDQISDMLPKSFEITHNPKKGTGNILINGSSKLYYQTNRLSYKSEPDKELDNIISKDTLNDRILRIFSSEKMKEDKYNVTFKMIDLYSADIPTIFNNRRNNNLEYNILNIYTIENLLLSNKEKEDLLKALFKKDK